MAIANQTYRLGGKTYLAGREIPDSVVQEHGLSNVSGGDAEKPASEIVQGAQKPREPVSLGAVPFTQTSVQEEAESYGLEPADFEEYDPSSEKGYTADDVRNITDA